MNRFSLTLQSCIEEWNITQKELVERSRIPKSTLSKFTRGKLSISSSKFQQLCMAFPEIYRGRLLKSYLEDQVPDWGKNLVQIDLSASHRLREESPRNQKTIAFDKMPTPLQKTFKGLAELSTEKPQIRELLIKLHQTLT